MSEKAYKLRYVGASQEYSFEDPSWRAFWAHLANTMGRKPETRDPGTDWKPYQVEGERKA